MAKKQRYEAVHLYDSTRPVEGRALHHVVALLVVDSVQDDGRPIEVEMNPSQARRWAASLVAMAEQAEARTADVWFGQEPEQN